METMDDAGVYRLTDELALIQTVDFFSPVVNDPYTFGRIAAANSLSDIWAMGGTPQTAMNILAYPAGQISPDVIEALLYGGSEVLCEAGVALVGGHTMEQETLVYGMSVSGIIHPGAILKNNEARIGDVLILTKALGTGVFSNAIQSMKQLPSEQETGFVNSMMRLNLYASQVFSKYNVSAMTDITGFGLLGHALPMARNAGVVMAFQVDAIPLLEGLPELMDSCNPKGVCKCRQYVEPFLQIEPEIDPRLTQLMMEAQTSGGLLAAIQPDQAQSALDKLHKVGDTVSAVIGEVRCRSKTQEGIYLKIE